MNRLVMAGIAVALAAAAVLAAPLFYDTEVDEDLPAALNDMQEGLTLEEFSSMDDAPRAELVGAMPEKLRDMIMDESARAPRDISEEMPDGPQILKSGQFTGLAGHSARGEAKILDVSGAEYLRFEDFEVTNGPDLRVYLTQDGDVKQGIHLDKLKGSRGSQNYPLDGIDTDVYGTVVIYCQPFGAYFGEARLG